MDSPVRKALKRNDYQRHKLFRKMKRLREARRRQEMQAAEKELKRKLRRPKFDEGSDDKKYKNVAPQYRSDNSVGGKAGRILSADPETNTALWQDEKTGRKRLISLPYSYWIESNTPEMMFSELPDQGEINEVIPSNVGIKRMHNALYPLSNLYYNDPLLGSYARFTDSWNNNTNPVRAIWDLPATQVAVADLLLGKGPKALLAIYRVNDARTANMSLAELDAYFDAHPSLVKKLGQDVVDNYKLYFDRNVRPRFQAALAEQNIPYTREVEESITRAPLIYYADFGPKSRWGGYTTSGGKIMLNSNSRIDPNRLDQTIAHEMHHNWRNNFGETYRSYPMTDVQMNPNKNSTFNFIELSKSGYTPQEVKALEDAYQFPNATFNRIKDISPIKEKGATNAEIVARISKDFGGATGEELDAIIKDMPRSKVEEYISTTNGYSRDFKKSKDLKWYNDVKKSWMTVASQLPFVVKNDSASYIRGKDIRIKQSKRGTFTAAAKKHGMGVQQYAKKVLKAPKGKYSAAMRRKANFARNASKWAH